jgi:hypothetical protein
MLLSSTFAVSIPLWWISVFVAVPREPAPNSKGKGKEKEKVAHKRQISETIPPDQEGL